MTTVAPRRGNEFEESLVLEHPDGLAHRRPADPELGREIGLQEAPPGSMSWARIAFRRIV